MLDPRDIRILLFVGVFMLVIVGVAAAQYAPVAARVTGVISALSGQESVLVTSPTPLPLAAAVPLPQSVFPPLQVMVVTGREFAPGVDSLLR